MIDILMKIDSNTVTVVSPLEISVGDEIAVGAKEGKLIMRTIATIHEQRKERGVYNDENKRRMWAKISY